VNNALRCGLIELTVSDPGGLSSGLDVAGLSRATEVAHVGAQGGLDSLVALARLLIGLHALDLRLNVRHWAASDSLVDVRGVRQKGTTGHATKSMRLDPNQLTSVSYAWSGLRAVA